MAITHVKQCISLFTTHLCICVTKYESNRSEEVAFAGPIAPYNNIMLGREGLNDRLLLVAVGKIRSLRARGRGREPAF